MDRPAGRNGSDSAASRRPVLRLVASNDTAPPRSQGESKTVKASRLEFAAEVSLDDAVACILSACLDHFTANIPALREKSDPEAIHQLRVALRRLRAFLGMLKRVAPSPELAGTAESAKAIAGALGPARDWQVFREGLEGEARELLKEEPGFSALLDAVELRRSRSQEAARATILAPTTQQFVQELRSLIARRPWRDHASGLESKGSARDFATRQLGRLHRRAVKRCEGVATVSPHRRHEARIALKKARYAAEFFESLFAAKRARAYLSAVAAIQEELGEDNDRATAARLLNEIAVSDDAREMTPAISLLSAWRARAQQSSVAKAKKSEKRSRALKPFWR